MMFDHVKILTYFFTIYARSSVPPKPSVSIIISLHILYKRVEGNHHRILLDTYSGGGKTHAAAADTSADKSSWKSFNSSRRLAVQPLEPHADSLFQHLQRHPAQARVVSILKLEAQHPILFFIFNSVDQYNNHIHKIYTLQILSPRLH